MASDALLSVADWLALKKIFQCPFGEIKQLQAVILLAKIAHIPLSMFDGFFCMVESVRGPMGKHLLLLVSILDEECPSKARSCCPRCVADRPVKSHGDLGVGIKLQGELVGLSLSVDSSLKIKNIVPFDRDFGRQAAGWDMASIATSPSGSARGRSPIKSHDDFASSANIQRELANFQLSMAISLISRIIVPFDSSAQVCVGRWSD